jgi:hypothetical protein
MTDNAAQNFLADRETGFSLLASPEKFLASVNSFEVVGQCG